MVVLTAAQGTLPLGPSNVALPIIGLGTFQVKGPAAYTAVTTALQVGYRHIDTAAVYRNEVEVGQAVRDSGLARDQIFITSKLAPKDQGSGVAYEAVKTSVNNLGLRYIDLYLIHWPGASGVKTEDPVNKMLRHESYRDLQKAHQEGLIRAVGVSNFEERHLRELLEDPTITVRPVLNQVEFHPYYQQRALREYCKSQQIVLQGYSSLGQENRSLRDHPVVHEIAKKRGKSPSQVLLRWSLDHGVPVIPKSTSPGHMAENLAVLAEEPLDANDRKALDDLDCQTKFAWDPYKVA